MSFGPNRAMDEQTACEPFALCALHNQHGTQCAVQIVDLAAPVKNTDAGTAGVKFSRTEYRFHPLDIGRVVLKIAPRLQCGSSASRAMNNA